MAGVDELLDRMEASKHLDTRKQVIELCSIRDQLNGLIGRLAVQLADTGGLGETRFTNPASWLAAESNRSKTSTTRIVRHTRLVNRYNGLAEGVEDDTLTGDHLDVLVKMVPARRSSYRAAMFDAHHRQLVQLARDHDFRDWARLCRAWLALDHRIARCVLDSPSRRVDLGRTQRLFTGAARDAIRWRDRHCQAPGCRRPARWCDIDHIVEWQHGGSTTPTNGQLLCAQHHRAKSDGLHQ